MRAVTASWRTGGGVLVGALTVVILAGCTAGPSSSAPVVPSGTTTVTSGPTGGAVTGPTDDVPSVGPSASGSPTGSCSSRSSSTGPAASLAILAIGAPASVAAGASVTVSAQIAVLSDGPRIVLQPKGSSVEVLRGTTVVARTPAPEGPEIPLPLKAGSGFPGQILPTAVSLIGCDGAPLPAGAYSLRAVLAYGSDPLNGSSGGSSGGFALLSDPPTDLTVT